MWRVLVFIVTACVLGGLDPAGELSFHVVTAAVVVAAVLAVPLGMMPRRLSMALQLVVCSVVIAVCIIDVYCQTYLMSGITPNLFISIFLTNTREATEFLSVYISADVLTRWRLVVLVAMLAMLPMTLVRGVRTWLRDKVGGLPARVVSVLHWGAWCGIALSLVVEVKALSHFFVFFSPDCDAQHTESLIFRHYDQENPTPVHRVIQAWLAARQSGRLLEDMTQSTATAVVDSCSGVSPHIVLIIGESYNKHHSSLYGYRLPTTPLQVQRRDSGELFVYEDVVTPWNITSNVFLNMFSTWNSADDRAMGSHPFFPALFRKGGYDVTFFSNQYAKGFRQGSTNQAGFFFLSNRRVCQLLFDFRNKRAYGLDMRLVNEFQEYKEGRDSSRNTLDIIHLIGQHFDYKSRYPMSKKVFDRHDIHRHGMSRRACETVMHYDNATAYNDMVLDEILKLYEDEEAVVLFVADHGEEVCDDSDVFGRLFITPTRSIARNEFEVPMWVWCSRSYIERHADVVDAIRGSLHRPFMTDDVPQLLFSLAGLHSTWVDDSRNILSDNYKTKKRIIAGEREY